jgi:hypothetical protein
MAKTAPWLRKLRQHKQNIPPTVTGKAKKMRTILAAIITFICIQSFSQDLDTIKSVQIEQNSELYESSIEKYKSNEFWGIWTMPVGDPFSTSALRPQAGNNYNVTNLSDYDLNTAWIEGKDDFGINEKFGFIFNFPENTGYADPYQFFGEINLFNGYCKSLKDWEQNSRVKLLKVYYNDKLFCYVELIDTWHFQFFDLSKYFKNERDKKFMDAPFEIVKGDKLTFEILAVYPGLKYKDVAISEFMAEGAGN